MPLLHKVDAVVGQGDVPLPGVNKAEIHLFCQGLAEPGKGAEASMSCWLGTHAPRVIGGGAISRILLRSKEMHKKEPIQPFNGLFRTSSLEQVVGPKHDD